MTELTPTPTQGRYLSYIHAYTEGFGFPPAESEIGKAMKVSPPSYDTLIVGKPCISVTIRWLFVGSMAT